MAAVIDASRYNSLVSLGEAEVARQHRHHTVGEGEAVVKVNGTAHQMDRQTMKDIVYFGNNVVPTTWMTSGSEVIPMKFIVTPSGTRSPCPEPSFIKELVSVLSSNGCNDLFGIDTIADCAWAEMTIGDASVVVPDKNITQVSVQENFIPVAFLFGDEEPGFRIHGRCSRSGHRHTGRPIKPQCM